MKRLIAFGLFLWGLFLLPALFADDAFKTAVQNDWARQEKTAGRTVESPEALAALVERSEALLSRLVEEEFISDDAAQNFMAKISEVKDLDLTTLSADEIKSRYESLRWAERDVIFANPLVKDIPIAFLRADRYIWQLIHEYSSYYYSHTNMVGGDLLILKNPGQSFETVSLSEGKFPRGVFATPKLSFDAKTLYFAFADFTKVVPEGAPRLTLKAIMDRGYDTEIDEYLARTDGKYHLYKMDLASGEVTQLTDGPDDDFDPCELPDGDLLFMSTRRGGFARCTAGYEPVETATLHRLMTKTGDVKCLSWHETNEWNPSVLQDGRIVYSRWDYVDREAARFMNLWITNPDGTNAQALFGNYTEKVVAALQAKEIPNSNKIMFLGSGHHIAVGGPIAILDPTKVSLDPETGEDSMDAIEVVTPDVPFPETQVPGDPEHHYVSDHYYYSPYPLSEDFYLTAYSHDPNGGYLARHSYGYRGTCGEPYSAGKLGLYYRDRFGNLELLFEDPEISCRYPMQVKERPVPNVIAPKAPLDSKSEWGTFVLSNVYESLMTLPEDRPIKELRIFQIVSHYPNYMSATPELGYPHAANARIFLGTVPVEDDGSAHFKAPAKKPLYFQGVDADGRAVRTMLSEVYLQPGENRGCVGCHEQTQTASRNEPVQGKALTRPASEITPGPDGSAPLSFMRLVQPILNKNCVSCHDGSEGSKKPDLRGEPEGEYTISYNQLRPYVRFHAWHSSESPSRIASRPGQGGADISRLSSIIDDENHGAKIGLTDEDRRKIYLWLDANVQFYGTGEYDDRVRQRQGEIVPIQDL